jgi:rhamnogalacturonyl hydrolase YesR
MEQHVDFSIFGVVPLEIYRLTGDTALRAAGLRFADRQWSGATSVISSEARYWADDFFMLPIVQLQAYRATGDAKYIDRTARFATAYLDSLQQPNGLFFHGLNSPFYWGRGNGWAAAGLTEALTSIPASHPARPRILAGYRLMMSTLLADQSPRGLWRQLITRSEAWEESSGSAMFTYALIAGVRRGWLESTRYGPAAQRAWVALVSELDERGNLRDICVGTGKAADVVGGDLEAQYRYYVARPRTTGDLHGQAPMLWAAAALLRNQ